MQLSETIKLRSRHTFELGTNRIFMYVYDVLLNVSKCFLFKIFVIKIFVLSYFEWPFYTGFTVCT